MDIRVVRREEKKVAERALKHWGVKAQLEKALQETVELAVAISHYDERRTVEYKGALINEMADCSIMIDQLKAILGLTDDTFQIERATKYQGLVERLALEGE